MYFCLYFLILVLFLGFFSGLFLLILYRFDMSDVSFCYKFYLDKFIGKGLILEKGYEVDMWDDFFCERE